jgi:heme exporter protein CcmD
MGYVIAAYAITIGAVGLYCAHLVRERRRLRRELDRGEP